MSMDFNTHKAAVCWYKPKATPLVLSFGDRRFERDAGAGASQGRCGRVCRREGDYIRPVVICENFGEALKRAG